MKQRIYLFLIAFLIGSSCMAQNQWDNWIFGNNAYVKFVPNSFALPSTSTKTMPSWPEGVSSVSDASGALLFYTNGSTVYKANGAVMTNGTGLLANGSSTEAALIVPNPAIASQYYVFTTEIGPSARLSYSIVSATGSPSVLLPSKNTLMRNNVAEKVAAIKVCGENAYWIVAHDLGNNQYVEWKLSTTGLTGPVIYSVGAVVSGTGNAGHLKFSPDGTLMAAAHVDLKKMELFNFNTSTGVISNIGAGVSATYSGQFDLPYGVEFSPDSKKLYMTIVGSNTAGQSRIYQFDVSIPANAIATQFIVHQYLPSNSPDYGYCSLQLGPDNRIYVLKRYIDSIYYIPSPNSAGGACGYVAANTGATRLKLATGTTAQMGLPNFPSRFTTCLTANAGVDDTICTGYATQLSGSSTGGSGGITYSWAPGTGLSCTNCQNPIAAPLTTTTYTLTVTSGGNTATDAVTVAVNQNCCSAGGNDLFTMINSNITISNNTYFTGKYYVGPGVIITVSTASLDLTNVDMVFSPCAGIEFHNGATLNANNSVFRPCDENLWWTGFSFFEGSIGTVNSCTYKNANNALSFSGTSQPVTYSNITNNLFLNCRKGVKIIAGADFLESITNNVFTVDFNHIDYSFPTCGGVITSPNEYHDIEVNASDLNSAYISQNQFINNQVGDSSAAVVSGIYFLSVSGGTISQNTFTNLYRDIDASASGNFSIENNEMELLQNSSSQLSDYQLRLSECNYVWVTGNHFVNSNEFADNAILSPPPTSGAIYSERNSYLNIKDNTIDGADNGIISFTDNFSSFTGNIINGANGNGIYLSDLQDSYVDCNQIHMQTHVIDGSTVNDVGIAYVGTTALDTEFPNSILSNCIFDADYAMLLSAGILNFIQGPKISNNYLYNYTYGGINNQGFLMGLGTGIATYAVAGHNTFTSNKGIDGVYDIYSTNSMQAWGNWGINTVNPNVQTIGNNVYSSTASCGQQIGPYANNQNSENICDLFFFNLQNFVLKPASGGMVLSPGFEETVNANRSEFSLSAFISLLQLLQASNPAEGDRLFALVEKDGWLSDTDFGELKFYHTFFASDFATAASDLEALNGSVDANWFAVKSILVNHINNDGSLNQISDDELQNLKSIEQSSSPFAADARELLQATSGGYDYQFKPLQTFKGLETGSSISVSQAQLNMYPNPVRGEVSVQYVLPDGLSEATLALYDLSGKLLESEQLEASNSVVKINLEKLANGSYLVAMENAGRVLLRGKLIKE